MAAKRNKAILTARQTAAQQRSRESFARLEKAIAALPEGKKNPDAEYTFTFGLKRGGSAATAYFGQTSGQKAASAPASFQDALFNALRS